MVMLTDSRLAPLQNRHGVNAVKHWPGSRKVRKCIFPSNRADRSEMRHLNRFVSGRYGALRINNLDLAAHKGHERGFCSKREGSTGKRQDRKGEP